MAKTRWSLVALFAPESVLYIALDQFGTAWKLRTDSEDGKPPHQLQQRLLRCHGRTAGEIDALGDREALENM